MEDQPIQLEKSKDMSAFMKENKIIKFLRKNVNIDYASVLQANGIPIIRDESNVIVHYTSPAGIKLTYMLPLLTRAIKIKSKGKSKQELFQ